MLDKIYLVGEYPMSHLNIEIKASCNRTDVIRKILKERNAVFKGVDQQVDTYNYKCKW